MKRCVILATLVATIVLAAGCGDGVAYTRRERQERNRRILDNDMKQLVDDWDMLWLNERESRRTKWRKE